MHACQMLYLPGLYLSLQLNVCLEKVSKMEFLRQSWRCGGLD